MKKSIVVSYDQLDVAEERLRHLLVNFKVLKAISLFSREDYTQKQVVAIVKKRQTIVSTIIKQLEDDGFLIRSIEEKIQKIDFTEKLFKVVKGVKIISS